MERVEIVKLPSGFWSVFVDAAFANAALGSREDAEAFVRDGLRLSDAEV